MIIKKYIISITCFMLIIFSACFCFSETSQDLQRHYRTGKIYFDNKLYAEAQNEFKKALEASDTKYNVEKSSGINLERQAQDSYLKSFNKNEFATARSTNDYIIGIGDTLAISVWDNADLSKEVTVRIDGKISFPLVDEIHVDGLTIPELDNILTEKLKEFIKYPDVNVSLKSMGESRVIILGEVRWPGVYSLDSRRTVLEAVAQAGGFTQDAVLNSVIVIKGGLDNPRAQRINLSKALLKANMEGDVVLVSQDIVYVPRKFISDLEYFINHAFDIMIKGVNNADQMRLYKNSR